MALHLELMCLINTCVLDWCTGVWLLTAVLEPTGDKITWFGSESCLVS